MLIFDTYVFIGSNFCLSGGTSASTPVFASVINCINEERFNSGNGANRFLDSVTSCQPFYTSKRHKQENS
jgi:tripeptidyl-peptidase-1